MARILKLIVAVGFVFLILMLSTYVVPDFFCILLSFLFAAALVVLLITSLREGIAKWRKASRLWPVPSLICLILLFGGYEISPVLGPHISDWMFVKHLDPFSKVVDDFRNGRVSCTSACNGNLEPIEVSNGPRNVVGIWGAQCDGDSVIVLFRFHTDVPLLHEGYLFKNYGETTNCGPSSVAGSSHLPYVRHVTGNWYHFSDQPGL